MGRETGRQGGMATHGGQAALSKWERPPSPKEALTIRVRTAATRWLDTQAGRVLEQDAVLAVLRRLRPVIALPRVTFVVGGADARAVLADPDAFTVGLYTRKLESIVGGFALAVDDPAAHGASRAVIDLAFLPGDVERLAARTATLAAEMVKGMPTVDVVGELAWPVLGRTAAEHLGLAPLDGRRFARWTVDIFRELFQNPNGDRSVARTADMAHAGLRAALAPIVARPGAEGTVLRRFHDAGLSPDAVTGNLIALGVAWIPNTAKAFTLALAELLARPDALAGARAAAREDDDQRLAGHCDEALRFRVPHLGVPRLCVRTRRLAATTIPAGRPVVALTKSAMRDARAVDEPSRFRPDRPPADYLTYGFGLHACVGAPVARRQIAALARPLLREPGLAPATGRRGRIFWDGPTPVRMLVTLGP